MSTRPILFGHSGLFGIVTTQADQASKLGLIILNAGMLPSPGPYGMSKQLVDALADLCLTTVRLDQSGKGESPSRQNLTPEDALLLDYDEVFSGLQKFGVEQTIIFGICSGAFDAVRICEERQSVAGLILLDGYVGRTRGWYAHRMRRSPWRIMSKTKKLLSLGPQAIVEKLRTRTGTTKTTKVFDQDPEEGMLDLRQYYVNALTRNVIILGIFTNTYGVYNHHGQLAETLASDYDTSDLEEIYYADADHTYTLTQHRKRAILDIRNWICRYFGQSVELS